MFAVVIFGTLCGSIYAPSLQSNAIDMIANEKQEISLQRCYV